jgi:hypothetical protein
MANWTNIVLLKKRGLELVGRLNKAIERPTFAVENASAIRTTSFTGANRRRFVPWIGNRTKRHRSPSWSKKRGFA